MNYTYFVHDTEHLRKIREAITANLTNHPLYIFQIGTCAQMQFDSNEDTYFIDETIAAEFSEYDFTNDLSTGNEEILLSITRVQSPCSSDDWGRSWNEDALISEKYLVKKRERPPAQVPHRTFWVFFGEEPQEYKIHLGLTTTYEYVAIDGPFGEGLNPKIISESYDNPTDAFWAGQRILKPKIELDFEGWQKQQKKKRRSNRK
ncbi:hypothetical protein LT679_00415 [Mucilaginibacter roseus]|uniref:Uncharacterized protein n=1 Tax=Mucilaginibacter roseus TaxID=1528868 RepID=A0ABS8TVY1_9SPHI|nr:hypothetical protein [Mucilaginibacter roseus]MCD8739048.1 hypothetical protein [Mucilaginibacter roseus]